MYDLNLTFCNVYKIPSGLMFIPTTFDHVKVSKVKLLSQYIGEFVMDDSFLNRVCYKEETVNQFDGLSLSSYYIFLMSE
jgi:hypothetical protein